MAEDRARKAGCGIESIREGGSRPQKGNRKNKKKGPQRLAHLPRSARPLRGGVEAPMIQLNQAGTADVSRHDLNNILAPSASSDRRPPVIWRGPKLAESRRWKTVSAWKRKAARLKLRMEIPADTTATVFMPVKSADIIPYEILAISHRARSPVLAANGPGPRPGCSRTQSGDLAQFNHRHGRLDYSRLAADTDRCQHRRRAIAHRRKTL